MKHDPDILWLRERWGLPPAAEQHVRRLVEAEAAGGTACLLEDEPSDWGRAAAPAKDASCSPLVLVPSEDRLFLQSRRLFTTERVIACKLRALAAHAGGAIDDALLDALFPDVDSSGGQRQAVRLAATRRLIVITGGPGTGKTYTVARALALLAAQGLDPARIKLAAPTGKAADRMKTSVAASIATLPRQFPASPDDLLTVASSAGTLHRLLGSDARSGRCRFHAGNRLHCSVLVVDECSMVDVFVWRALLEALPDDARLILVGDPFQLESVGTGSIFRELANLAASGDVHLSHGFVELTHSHRFQDRPAIGELAASIRRGDAATALSLLESSRGPEAPAGVTFLPAGDRPLAVDQLPASLLEKLRAIATAEDPGTALELLSGVCVLTAHRRFGGGAEALGARIEQHMASLTGTRNHPVIIDRNDPATGLSNGTLGIIREDDDGTRRAWFPGSDGTPRHIPLGRLPEHSPAWAVTIHRAQGSEYDEVLVVLPREDSPLATRELLYTGITRARRNLHVHGHAEAVRQAVRADSRRMTLLSAALQSCQPTAATAPPS